MSGNESLKKELEENLERMGASGEFAEAMDKLQDRIKDPFLASLMMKDLLDLRTLLAAHRDAIELRLGKRPTDSNSYCRSENAAIKELREAIIVRTKVEALDIYLQDRFQRFGDVVGEIASVLVDMSGVSAETRQEILDACADAGVELGE